MDSKGQFYALEVMSRERAAVARKEMEYWLNEAQEWEQLRKAASASMPPASSCLRIAPGPNE
jgi:hypothetical protein